MKITNFLFGYNLIFCSTLWSGWDGETVVEQEEEMLQELEEKPTPNQQHFISLAL